MNAPRRILRAALSLSVLSVFSVRTSAQPAQGYPGGPAPYPPQQYPQQPYYPPQQYPQQRPAPPPQQPYYPPQQYPQQRPAPPPPQYPPPQQPYYPPQQRPALPPQYPPPQRPPQYPPQQYAPQYPPQQYAPQYPPQQYAPQYPPPVAPQPQQQYPQQYSPGYPGYAPYTPPAPPPDPGPLRDNQLRYRQTLGAYQRSYQVTPEDPKKKRASYVRLADRSRRHHDGLYFRFGGGIGVLHDSAKSNISLPSKLDFRFEPVPFVGSGGGTAGVTEVAIGYTVTSGLVLGAGVYTATAPHPSLDVTDPHTGSYQFRVSQLAVFSALADWYFLPSYGFHVQVGPGVAAYVAGSGEPDEEGPQAQAHTAVGFGLMLGVGYDFWVADEWSLGVLGRFLYGSMSGSDDRGVSWTHSTYSPAALLTATFN